MNTLHHRHWPRGVPMSLTLPATSLWFNLEVSATRYPDKAALLFYDTAVPYREFRESAERLAGYLQQACGVKRGDRVALYMQNSPQFMMAFYAILRADAMVVPVNAMLTTEEVRHLVGDSGARVMFAAQELGDRIGDLLADGTLAHAIAVTYSDYLREATQYAVPDFVRAPRRVPTGMTSWSDAMAAGHRPDPHLAGPDDLCVMPYTSGTTGAPKGCIHTHATVMATLVAQTVWYGGSVADTVTFCTLPLFHVTAMQASMNTPLYIGSTIVILPRWDRATAARMIERHRISHWTNITTMVVDFLSSPDVASLDLSSLKRIGGGGAAMPEAVAQRLKDITGMDYVEGYGLSETIAPSHINPPDRPKKQCLGVPIFDVDSRVVNPDTLEEVAIGQVGEIITHGPQVFKGYWRDEQKTKDAFIEKDGKTFFRTGDLARIDEDGYFFLVDRLKRMINASGYKVWPAEIEAMLYAHPDIQEACVIAARDAHRGETVKAFVVPRESARGRITPEAVIDWAKERMAAYKYPRQVEFVDALPKSGTGKVQWRVLQEHENAQPAT